MPIYNWNKINETNNYVYLRRKSTKKKISKAEIIIAEKKWRELLDEFIARFGFTKEFLAQVRLQKEILRLRIERLVNDDETLTMRIEILEKELEESQKANGEVQDFFEVKTILEKKFQFHINAYITSVAEYYSYIGLIKKEIEEENKRQLKDNGRRTN